MFAKLYTEYQLLSNLLDDEGDDCKPKDSKPPGKIEHSLIYDDRQEYNLWHSKGFAPGRNLISKSIKHGSVCPYPFPPPTTKLPLPIGAEIKMKKTKKCSYSLAVKIGLKEKVSTADYDDVESTTGSSSGSESTCSSTGSSVLGKIVVVPNPSFKKRKSNKKKSHAPVPVAPSTPKIGGASKFAVLKVQESEIETEEAYEEEEEVVEAEPKKKNKKSKKSRRSSYSRKAEKQSDNVFITMIQMLLLCIIEGCTAIHDKVVSALSAIGGKYSIVMKVILIFVIYTVVLWYLIDTLHFIEQTTDQNTLIRKEYQLNQWVFEQLNNRFTQ